jgi:hypothetical protein
MPKSTVGWRRTILLIVRPTAERPYKSARQTRQPNPRCAHHAQIVRGQTLHDRLVRIEARGRCAFGALNLAWNAMDD